MSGNQDWTLSQQYTSLFRTATSRLLQDDSPTSPVLLSAPPLQAPIPEKAKKTVSRLPVSQTRSLTPPQPSGDRVPCYTISQRHIIIDHHAPILYPICHKVFGSATDRDKHIVARTCIEREMARGLLAGVNEDQVEKLILQDIRYRRAQGRNTLEKRRWFRMWDIIFPGESRPSSPYLASAKELETVALCMFWRPEGRHPQPWRPDEGRKTR